MDTEGPRWLPCRPAWEKRDRHRWMGPTAAAGVVAGAVLAVAGLPPVDLHGPLHYAGVMGPLCGATRGVRAVMLGDLGTAWGFNPLSPVLVAGAAVAVVREATGRLGGRWLNLRVTRRRTALALCLVPLAVLTVNQQAHADLLRSGPETGTPTGLLLYGAALPVIAAAVTAGVIRRRSGRA